MDNKHNPKLRVTPAIGDFVEYVMYFNDMMNTPPTETRCGIVSKKAGKAPHRKWWVGPERSTTNILHEADLLALPGTPGRAVIKKIYKMTKKFPMQRNQKAVW